MFKLIAQKAVIHKTSLARAAFSSNAAAPTSSVMDLLIDLTFVDPSGARRKVTGLIGKALSPKIVN